MCNSEHENMHAHSQRLDLLEIVIVLQENSHSPAELGENTLCFILYLSGTMHKNTDLIRKKKKLDFDQI